MNLRHPRTLVSLIILLTSSLHAAEEKGRPDITLFSYESRLTPRLELKDPIANSFEENAEVDVDYHQLKALLPWRPKPKNGHLSATLGFESLSLRYHNWNENADPTMADDLYAVQVSFTYRRPLKNERWGLHSFLTPSLNSDYKKLSGRAFRLQGGLLFTRKIKTNNLSLGLVLINDYGTPRVYPAVAYAGKIGERQNFMVRLPVLASWGYEFTEQTEAGVAARVSGNNFYISEEGRYHGHQVKYSIASVGPYLKWKPVRSLILGLETGLAFHHDFEYVKDGDTVRDLDFKPSPVAVVSARWIF